MPCLILEYQHNLIKPSRIAHMQTHSGAMNGRYMSKTPFPAPNPVLRKSNAKCHAIPGLRFVMCTIAQCVCSVCSPNAKLKFVMCLSLTSDPSPPTVVVSVSLCFLLLRREYQLHPSIAACAAQCLSLSDRQRLPVHSVQLLSLWCRHDQEPLRVLLPCRRHIRPKNSMH